MFKGRKREHSKGIDGEDDGRDVQEGLTAKRVLEVWDDLMEQDQVKIIWTTQQEFLKQIASFPVMPAQMGPPQMALRDSEVGKTVRKLRRLFRPTVKGTIGLPGWRAWGLLHLDEEYCLTSISAIYIWHGPVATTAKNENNDELKRVAVYNPVTIMQISPHLDYGIYSYKTPMLLNLHHGIDCFYVVGRVESYGHVVEHEWGYRAQKVIIRELWVLHNLHRRVIGDMIEKLSKRYDCPVHKLPFENLGSWTKFYTEEEKDG